MPVRVPDVPLRPALPHGECSSKICGSGRGVSARSAQGLDDVAACKARGTPCGQAIGPECANGDIGQPRRVAGQIQTPRHD